MYSQRVAAARTLIIVPTYNERDNVSAVVREFLRPVAEADLLFVDDASPDGTGELLDELAKGEPRVHVLHRAGKQGLGTAYLAGFDWALDRDYDTIVEMDADFSHDPRYLPGMIERARSGVDVVIGSRYVGGGGTRNWGLGRRLLSRGGGIYARLVLGMRVRDLTSGFVCYRRDALACMPLREIRSNGYSFQIEMKYQAHRLGLTLAEIPIIFEDRRVGQSKMSLAIIVEALVHVWRLRLGT